MLGRQGAGRSSRFTRDGAPLLSRVRGRPPRASRCAPSSPCSRSLAAGQAHLVSGTRVWAWHRDGLERPSPIKAPDMLTIESFKSQRIRGPAPKSQRG